MNDLLKDHFKKGVRDNKVIVGVSLIKAYYMHVQKYHNETFVQLMYVNQKREKRKLLWEKWN
jgi:hypothetical protein